MRKFKKSGFLKNKSYNIISRFFLSSFIVILFFYVVPIIINFTDKNFSNEEFTKNSKNILNNVLNKENDFDEEDLETLGYTDEELFKKIDHILWKINNGT